MNVAVVTPCAYASRSKIRYLDESCARQGISLIPHAIGKTFGGWADLFCHQTIPAMRDLLDAGYTHALVVDGIDTLIVSPLDEIIGKYLACDAPPCLMSADCEAYPSHLCAAFTGEMKWKFLNAGCYLAELPYFIDLAERLHGLYPNEGNHQAWFAQQWPIDGLNLDHSCEIFQSMGAELQYEILSGRLRNLETGSQPCVLHFRGGYCDPVTGRDERMRPILEQLYGCF